MWASQLLGVLSSQRYALPLEEAASPDHLLAIGEPLIEAVARVGGTGAGIALTLISRVDDGELGVRAGELAAKAESGAEDDPPGWIDDVGEANVTGAAFLDSSLSDAPSVPEPGSFEVVAAALLMTGWLGLRVHRKSAARAR